MTSIKTQLPYEYYNSPVHCKPESGIKYKSENLGEILRGDRIVNTPYEIRMRKNSECQVLCSSIKLNEEQSNTLIKRIKNAYHVHLYVSMVLSACLIRLTLIHSKAGGQFALCDQVPLARHQRRAIRTRLFAGFHQRRSGLLEQSHQAHSQIPHRGRVWDTFGLFSILLMTIFFRSRTHRVVGFEVETKSIDFEKIKVDDGGKTCAKLLEKNDNSVLPQLIKPNCKCCDADVSYLSGTRTVGFWLDVQLRTPLRLAIDEFEIQILFFSRKHNPHELRSRMAAK
jgi:hypothetical protein